MSQDELGVLYEAMKSGRVDKDHRIQGLVSDTINNRAQTGVWDTTKANAIYEINALAGGGLDSGSLDVHPERSSAMDMSKLGDDTVFSIATDPKISMDDPTRMAAEEEVYKRGLDK